MGLGDAFLRHIERTRVLLHMVDLCPLDGSPAEHYRQINGELREYSPDLAGKPQIVGGSKLDLTGSRQALARLAEDAGVEAVGFSAATGEGLEVLTERLWQALHP